MDFEKELERVVRQYRDEGYSVVTRPEPGQLDGLVGVAADILATRGNETAVVQVKRTRADVEADPGISRQAAAVNTRPGWRFDLVILGTEAPIQRLARKATEPSDDQLRAMLDRARSANATGFREMALTYSWAALEATMRRVRGEAELYGRITPTALLTTLYGNGFLSRTEFERSQEALTIRNQIVHGFVPPEIDSSLIDDLLALAEKVGWGEHALASLAAG